ncbi:hypothetical protein [Flavisolibacter tropicus]|uniref:HYR domain-containing protein n=1 Tax=Flavisolibacter tropicus TaxID=1492898 RepID=A0A172U1N2_9BACT|nr:hypothetical protein [Flavisolibacter tropicus]ANE53220.1 hypothetical protein SY85_24915 [Flavisolibacter tropicus]
MEKVNDIHTTSQRIARSWLHLLEWLRLLMLLLTRIKALGAGLFFHEPDPLPQDHILSKTTIKHEEVKTKKQTNMKLVSRYIKWGMTLLLIVFAKCVMAQSVGPYPFTGNDKVCVGQTKSYGVTENPGSTYAWTITPGIAGTDWVLTSTSASGNTITVQWLIAGTYTLSVTETTSDGCAGDAVPIQIIVNPLPVCSITGPNNICPGSTNVYNAPIGMATYSWSISGGATIAGATNGQTVSVLANNACGSFTVSLTITNANGCTSTCSQTFDITAPPVVLTAPADFTATSCQTQAQINTAYTTWLASVTSSGGCNLTVTNNSAGAPLACGGTTTVIWTATSPCEPNVTDTATFTVTAAPALTLPAAQNQTIAACSTQAQVDAAYAAWLASVNASGGCNTSVTNNAPASAPAACGGSVAVTWTAISACDTLTTTATFTVTAAPALTLPAAQNQTIAACSTQAQVDAAYAAWLASVNASGGCNTSVTNNAPASAPAACGGSVAVTWTAISACDTLTTTATFTVTAAPALTLPAAQNQTIAACSTQAQVDAAYAAWLASVNASGGCNTSVTNNAPASAPAACGGSVAVTWTAISACDTLTTTATFTVTAAPALTLPAAQNQTIAACSTQAQVDAAYAAWLASVNASGGCNTSVTNNAPASAPAACGGSVAVTWTAISACDTLTTTATFTVTAAPALTLPAAQNQTIAACSTQAQVDAAYAAWLASVNASGGCNTSVTNNAPASAPAACGGSVAVTWTAISACDTLTTTATFTVTAAPALTLPAAQNQTIAACSTQAQVDAAYAAWLASVNASGGCNTSVTNNAPASAPAACGGSVAVTWTAISACDTLTTTATFTVTAAPALTLPAAQNQTIAACSTQAQVDAAYAAWLASVNASGGCNTSVTNNAPASAPAACGGSVAVTWTAISACDTLTTTATFTVTAAPALTLPAAQNQTIAACSTQAQVDAAYAAWLASVNASGGCNTSVTNNAPASAPAACGGSVAVTWTAISACDTLTTTATFTVTAAPALTLPAAQNQTIAACSTQAQVDAAYAAWLASVNASGGCNTSVTNNAPASAPAACGGSVAVTWTAISACDTLTTTATFTVTAAPALTLPAAQNQTIAACSTQAQVDAAYAAWLASVNASGGCNTSVTNNAPASAPAACGGSVAVTWTAISACDTLTTTATFTVTAAPALTLPAAQNQTIAACSTQAQVDAAYAAWLASVNASGGCNTSVTNNAPASAPAACGGSVAVTWTAISACDTLTTTATFTVTAAPALTLPAAQNQTIAACSTQAQVDAAYAAWLASVNASGGCNTSVTNNAPASAPAACGGSVAVTWTAISACDTLTTTATFTVTAAPALTLPAAQNQTIAACSTQAQVDAAYAAWLASVNASGGCNTSVTNNAPASAPAACGGSVAVTWTAISACDTLTTTATFTVTAAPALTLPAAQNQTIAACSTQAQVDAAYAAWLASVNASGGCNTSVTNNAPASAPAACGGSVAVTWTAISACDTLTTTATFTVTAAPALTLPAAQNQTIAACSTQAQVDAAYAAWLASVNASGGCNTSVTNNAPASAPAACGGSVAVTWTAISACDTLTTTATFTVTAAPALTLPAAQNQTIAACSTQAQVDAAYAAWLASVNASGGCNTSVTNNAPASAPAACGGSVAVTWTAISACDTLTTTATFTVTAAPALTLPAAQNQTIAACSTQAQVDAAYAAWLASVNASGGCNTSVTNNAPASAPAACGGSVAVTWTAISACDTLTTTATFTVTAAPALTLPAAQNQTIAACSTQAQVDAAYAAWLASVNASGGCNTSVTNNAPASAPAACGGSVAVTWTAISACDTLTTTATFTVTAAPALTLPAAQNQTIAACSTQAQVDAAYAAWLASVNASGGCNTSVTNNAPASAPAACGGSVAVTWTAISACDTLTTTATFTVTAAPALTLPAAQNQTIAACSTQAQVDAAYAAWLASVNASGGCNTSVTNNAPASAPAACGGSVAVTWTAISACDTLTTTATFTVTAAPALTLPAAQNQTIAACSTQAQVDAAYAAWLASVNASGGCNTSVTNNAPASAPAACGGSVAVTWTAISACDTLTTTATFTVTAAPALTLTCPPAQTFCEGAGNNYTIPTLGAPDNCSGRILTITFQITGATTRSGTGTDASGIFNLGVSTITWTVSDACGNTATCSTSVTINPLPDPVISGPDPVCVSNDTVTYSTKNVGCNTYSWTVSAGGTIIGPNTGSTITVQWATAGTKTVTVTETMCGTGCSTTVSKTVIVNPKPVTTPITHN